MPLERYYVVLSKKGPSWTPGVTPELEALQERHVAHCHIRGLRDMCGVNAMNNKFWLTLSLILIAAVLALAACQGDSGQSEPSPTAPADVTGATASPEAGLANPASVYCEEQGGRLEIREDASGGQYGVCLFDDGSECEEWAFFRGECQPGQTQRAEDLME